MNPFYADVDDEFQEWMLEMDRRAEQYQMDRRHGEASWLHLAGAVLFSLAMWAGICWVIIRGVRGFRI